MLSKPFGKFGATMAAQKYNPVIGWMRCGLFCPIFAAVT